MPLQAGQSNNRYSISDFVNRPPKKIAARACSNLKATACLKLTSWDGVDQDGINGRLFGRYKVPEKACFGARLTKLFKRFTGEGTTLTKAEGKGTLYLADFGKKISILNLQGESICANGNDLLAFEGDIEWDIKMIRKVSGMLAGGLFNVNLSGNGMIAITTHHDPLTLSVSPNKPIITDPNATVAGPDR